MKKKISTKPTPRRGEIWLVRFPFTDLAATKVRPALVVAVHGEDAIVVGIFSRLPAGTTRSTWVQLPDTDADFARTGLKRSSLLKAEKIAVIHRSVLVRKLGTLSPRLLKQVEPALKRALRLS